VKKQWYETNIALARKRNVKKKWFQASAEMARKKQDK
jgi:hypothetical protein